MRLDAVSGYRVSGRPRAAVSNSERAPYAVTGLPSEYVHEHCYWGFQHDFVGIQHLRHQVGVDRMLWAIDFPHQDSEWPNSMDLIRRMFDGVPADETRKMVAENAIELFHLDGVAVTPESGTRETVQAR